MCRQNQLFGCILLGFGLGMLVGLCLEGGFLCSCLSIGLVIGGFYLLSKK